VDEYNSLVDKYNSGQVSIEELNDKKAVMKELEGAYNQLVILLAEQQAKLDEIPPKMQSLVQ